MEDHETKPVHVCVGCGLPEIGYHARERGKDGKMKDCPQHDQNIYPIVFWVLQKKHMKEAFGMIYREIFEKDEEKLRDWLMRDPKKIGDTGIMKMMDWWIFDVCGDQLG